MPVLPPKPEPIAPPSGFRVGAASAGVKDPAERGRRDDIMLLVADVPVVAAGVFTQNEVRAACVAQSEAILKHDPAGVRALVANSGNANCLSGKEEEDWTRRMREAAAQALGLGPEQVLAASTGVIGEPFPIARVAAAIPEAAASLGHSPAHWQQAAEAIRTTDTHAKWACEERENFRIMGIAKGSGMIHPRMATMLAFVATDLALPQAMLARLLRRAVAESFHTISVDGDTSTNDCVIAFAHAAKAPPSRKTLQAFARALQAVCMRLARQIVLDGEGASRCMEIAITGARTKRQARKVAEAIATSPLVKTALAGADPNWGRILAAAGKAQAGIARARLSLWMEDVRVVEGGVRAAGYREEQGAEIFARPFFRVRLDLGLGRATARMLTTDLSYDYVRINAEYRT